MYHLLLKNSFVPPTAEAKILRHGFTPETVQKVYELPFQIKHDIIITMFQYRIIHNILTTKMSLFRANFSDNDVRPQCLPEAHSLDHMFLRCSSVVAYWKTFRNWWTNKTKEQLTLSNSKILCGVFEKNGTWILFELCASNCEIFHILKLPKRREALFRQFSHTSKRKIKHTERNSSLKQVYNCLPKILSTFPLNRH